MVQMTAVGVSLLVLTSLLFVEGGACFLSHSTTSRSSRRPFLTTCIHQSAREDFYHEPHFQVATTSSPSSVDMNRMLECAQQGECSVQEMDRMIADLNGNEEKAALKQALVLQRELVSLKNELLSKTIVQSESPKQHGFPAPNHAFEHYVDYKDIGAYESH